MKCLTAIGPNSIHLITSCRDCLLKLKGVVYRNLSQGMDHLQRTSENTREKEMSKAVVTKITKLSPTVKGLTLKVNNPDVAFKAGQWLDMFIPGVKTVGGFSMSSSPSLLKCQHLLELAVKCSNHPPAKWVHSQCEVGSQVSVRVGGDFYFDPSENSSRGGCLLLVAGGVGINPMVSIIRHISDLQEQQQKLQQQKLQQQQPDKPVCKACLLYSARSADELIFRTDLDAISQEHQNVRLQYYVTGEDQRDSGNSYGRIKHQDIAEAVGWLDCQPEQVDAYICGPGPMIDDACLSLTRLALPASSVHFEKWW